jgi:hypothetical protein
MSSGVAIVYLVRAVSGTAATAPGTGGDRLPPGHRAPLDQLQQVLSAVSRAAQFVSHTDEVWPSGFAGLSSVTL